ncbi:MAG: hypothetical protein ABL898_19260, partial [Hyphomicrobiaceae bacterium]
LDPLAVDVDTAYWRWWFTLAAAEPHQHPDVARAFRKLTVGAAAEALIVAAPAQHAVDLQTSAQRIQQRVFGRFIPCQFIPA